jgi:hypothetical protein
MLWLTPVRETENGWLLGKERVVYPEPQLAPLLHALRDVHPRLLPLVKAAVLPDEPTADETTACGTAADFDLSVPGDIVFDGRRWLLSHCGKSFFSILLPVNEALSLFMTASHISDEIIGQITGWLKQGMYVVIIKE